MMKKGIDVSRHHELLKLKSNIALAAINEWLRAGQIDRSLNWLGLAEAASTKSLTAARQGSREDALGWAEVNIRVHEVILCAVEPQNTDRYQLNAMMMRITMIRKYGVELQHPILDPEIIERWALAFPKVSMEQARKYKDYPTIPIELRLRLGKAYNRLKVLVLLYDIINREHSPDVQQALDLWNVLKERNP